MLDSLAKTHTMGSSSRTAELEREDVPLEVTVRGGVVPSKAPIRQRCAEARTQEGVSRVPPNIALDLLKQPVNDVAEFARRSPHLRDSVGDSPMLDNVLHGIGWALTENPSSNKLISAEECCAATGIQPDRYRFIFRRFCRKTLQDWQWELLKGRLQCL